jgi:hypothetical protein
MLYLHDVLLFTGGPCQLWQLLSTGLLVLSHSMPSTVKFGQAKVKLWQERLALLQTHEGTYTKYRHLHTSER